MEITKTKIAGTDVNVIYTGTAYYFHSSFYGLVAVARRTVYQRSVWTNDEPARMTFEILAGNRNCIGGALTPCTVYAAVKRFINKDSNRYVKTDVTYTETARALDACGLRVEFWER